MVVCLISPTSFLKAVIFFIRVTFIFVSVIRLYIVTDLIKVLLGNGSVNTSQHATIQGKLCFLCCLS
jgi:hypothetical protein